MAPKIENTEVPADDVVAAEPVTEVARVQVSSTIDEAVRADLIELQYIKRHKVLGDTVRVAIEEYLERNADLVARYKALTAELG